METHGEDLHSPFTVEGWKAYSYLTVIQYAGHIS